MPLRNVQPGDLITSDDWNALVAALNALQAEVDNLASGNSRRPPQIIQVLPSDTVTAGDTIRIFGSNFDYSKGGQSVFFGNTRAINFRSGSSDSLLIVDVPDPVEGATEAGTPLTMTVANLVGTASYALTVKSKPVVITGGIEFTFISSEPVTPTPGLGIKYNFLLHSTASQDLVVTLNPVVQVDGVSPNPIPSNALEVHDDDASLRPNRQISLPEGQAKTVSIQVAQIPKVVPSGIRYKLSVTASAPGIRAVTETTPIQIIGLPSEQPDATITSFAFNGIIAGQGAFTPGVSADGTEGTLQVAAGTTATIEMQTQFANIPGSATHHYQLSAAVDDPAGGWSAVVNKTIQNPLAVPGPGGLESLYFDVTAPGNAATATLRLTLTHQEAATNNKRSVAYRLQLKQ